ncbi:fatty acid desaturase [Staphylotrichum tortipilum]|uniref:Fatty acid desaturase n=1 Tax=Staphylotrichum tortipilum TaxID=2831512 RepID=A0AAN6ME05_9PEZI|nr:fatty acid desaturase [Staphylotrichum longicolle]
MDRIVFSPELTVPDTLLLRNLADDIQRHKDKKIKGLGKLNGDEGYSSATSTSTAQGAGIGYGISAERDARDIQTMAALNDPQSKAFEPTVISSLDLPDLRARLPAPVFDHLVLPYISWARKIVRHETDVLMLTHLIMYFTTSLPSAVWLFYRFTYLHGALHFAMQFWYLGTYTLMMHQHIHMNGILGRDGGPVVRLVDTLFPYVTDPLMGHTWNTYFYHHVKHHHIEGNGPDDLSSTIRYQRDELLHFLHYVGRFLVLIWLDLPMYFWRTGRKANAVKAGSWELANYAFIYAMFRVNSRAATFSLLLPLILMRTGLMVGNWGQHAFVDADEPESDFRSSVTLIDVPSNRYCYNDGYHTSHHLNPRRHWRHHPVAFLRQKETYAAEKALVFHDIDYLMITVRLLMKDYAYLARCLVPIGEQMDMTLDERAAMLRRHTRRFSEEEIREKFPRAAKGK